MATVSLQREMAHPLKGRAGRLLRENGLTLTLLGVFLVFLAAQAIVGARELNQESKPVDAPHSHTGSG